MDQQKEAMCNKSYNKHYSEMIYKPDFLQQEGNIDEKVNRINYNESILVDDTDLARHTTSWIHRIVNFVGTIYHRKNRDKNYIFHPKFD